MTQHDYSIANQTFSATRTDINNVLSAILGLNAGTSAPSTTVAGLLWYDTTNGLIKQRNAADSGWLTLYAIGKQGLVSQDGATIYAADAGSNDTYAVTLSPAPTAYATSMVVYFKANTANTGAATLNVNSLGAITIKKNYNSDLADGDIKAGQIVQVIYDGTNFQLLSPVSNSFNSALSAISAKTTTYTAVGADNGAAFRLSGTWTLSLTAAATLGAKWYCFVKNEGTGNVTIDPSGSETANGLTQLVLGPNSQGLLVCDGSNFHFFGRICFKSTAQTISSAGTLTIPHGLGVVPAAVSASIKCNSSDAGWSPSDPEILVGGVQSDSGAATVGVGCLIYFDATNVYVLFGSNTTPLRYFNKSTGAQANLTNAKWDFYVRAEI